MVKCARFKVGFPRLILVFTLDMCKLGHAGSIENKSLGLNAIRRHTGGPPCPFAISGTRLNYLKPCGVQSFTFGAFLLAQARRTLVACNSK